MTLSPHAQPKKIFSSGIKKDGEIFWSGWIPSRWGEGQFVYDIWISPKTGDDVARCPWLRKLPGKEKYACRIHDVKPVHCREYPRSREHAAETGCKEF